MICYGEKTSQRIRINLALGNHFWSYFYCHFGWWKIPKNFGHFRSLPSLGEATKPCEVMVSISWWASWWCHNGGWRRFVRNGWWGTGHLGHLVMVWVVMNQWMEYLSWWKVMNGLGGMCKINNGHELVQERIIGNCGFTIYQPTFGSFRLDVPFS